jgi:hypothetical protein
VRRKTSCLLPFAFLVILSIFVDACFAEDILQDFKNIKRDYKNFYLDGNNLIALGAGIGVAGILANTSADRDMQEYYQDRIRGKSTDSISEASKIPGEVFITVPALVGTRFLFKDTAASEWSQKSLRAIIVGAPAGLFIQRATGVSRPYEDDSKWRPFKDNNGLSGHAFIGAVPFITAARMNDNAYIKGILYGLSFLPALSRTNDDKHYLSQVALGWYLAFLSCNAVEKTDSKNKTVFLITPLSNRAAGIFISRSF